VNNEVALDLREEVTLQAPRQLRNRGFEDDILVLESRVPGVGGLYFEESSGTFVLLLTGSADSKEALSQLKSVAELPTASEALRAYLSAGTPVRIEHANYPFSQIVAFHERLRNGLFQRTSVSSIDSDERTNRLRIGVPDAVAAADVSSFLIAQGIPSDAFLIEVQAQTSSLGSTRGTFRPYGGGIQIANSSASRCTLGFDVRSSLNEVGILTASHCSNGSIGSGTTGGTIYQPTIPAGSIGTVAINPPWNLSGSGCGAYPLCTDADVAFVSASTTTDALRRVAMTQTVGQNYGGGSITFIGWWTNLPGTATPFVGLSLDKQGRTTGWTRGSVSSTCEDILVDSVYVVLCSDKVTNSRVGQGDSGAPVFYLPSGGGGSALYPAGILFAGGPMNAFDGTDGTWYCTTGCHYYFSRWSSIEAHLGRTLSASP